MLSKVCASWLIVLVLLPFTAPFSIFDLSELLTGGSNNAMGRPSSRTPMAALARAALSGGVPVPLRAVRHRSALTRLRASSPAAIAPVPTPRLYGAVACHIVHRRSCPVVLRI